MKLFLLLLLLPGCQSTRVNVSFKTLLHSVSADVAWER